MKKKKATIFLCLPILTIPTFVFTLYPGVMGKGESEINKEGEKEKRMGWERQPVTERERTDSDEEQK